MNYVGLKKKYTHNSSEDFQFTLAQQKQQRRTAMKWSEQLYNKVQQLKKSLWTLVTIF